MNDGNAVVLPLSWRSYARAAFFISILLVFGGGAALGSTGAVRVIGVGLITVGVVAGSDFAMFTRRWCLADDRLHVPRAWSPRRTHAVTSTWRPQMDDVGVRDSMFVCGTGEGNRRVTPNLMVARSDVMQWLFLIGEARQVAR